MLIRTSRLNKSVKQTKTNNETAKKNESKEKPKKSFLASLPLNETTVEIPEVLLGISDLQTSHPTIGNTLRAGVGGIALLKSVQAFTHEPGALGKMEGLSALGLAVSAGGSIVGGPTGAAVGQAGEAVHGLCEIALGAAEMKEAVETKGSGLSKEVVAGLLGVTKGVTTFLPMIATSTGLAVSLLHLGILTTKALM